jgi:hypothetical protein
VRALQNIFNRFRAVVRRKGLEDDLRSELRFHVDRQIEQNISSGMSPQEARRAVEGLLFASGRFFARRNLLVEMWERASLGLRLTSCYFTTLRMSTTSWLRVPRESASC